MMVAKMYTEFHMYISICTCIYVAYLLLSLGTFLIHLSVYIYDLYHIDDKGNNILNLTGFPLPVHRILHNA